MTTPADADRSGTRPRLLILSISRIVSDPRVLKQVEVFRDDYDVATCGLGPPPDGVTEHFRIPDGSRGWADDRCAILLRRYRRAYWNMSAVREASLLLPRGTFDGVLANDLNTVPLALSLDARFGVHADLHEYAPREREEDRTWRMFVAPFMRWIARRFLPEVHSATTVTQGIAAEYEKNFGVRFAVVTNAAPFTDRAPTPVGETIRLFHSAAGQRYRHLEIFLDLMRNAPPNVSLDLIVMPHEPDYVAELRRQAEGIPSLRFRDPVPYAELVDTVAQYDVALAFLPPTNFNLANALPNKFFEAVQARVGLIIGPSPEMARILCEYELGAIADDFSLEALRRTIGDLDRAKVEAWKRAAHHAAPALSAEPQLRVWRGLVNALFTAAPTRP